MQLRELIKKLDKAEISGNVDKNINGITYDSRFVKDGDIFVAISGLKDDGNRYIKDAVKRGASAVVSIGGEDKALKNVAWIKVSDPRTALALLSDLFYGHPSGKIDLTGITGTNGKTTTSYLAEGILKAAGRKCGVIGTINYRFGKELQEAQHTTPEGSDLQRMLKNIHDEGGDSCVMEVSSHSLVLNRIIGCEFKAAVFTNISHEHLDFHKTEEEYFKAKLKLFTEYKVGCSVINIDDIYGEKIVKGVLQYAPTTCLTYGIKKKADIAVVDMSRGALQCASAGLKFTAKTPSGDIDIDSKLTGRHNIYNILSAIGIGLANGVSLSHIEAGINHVERVPGRFDVIDEGKGFLVVVDYAHTDDALKNVITAARGITKNRVITLFGCGGDRDKTKRPLMGKAAVLGSDFTIITSDNPRSEDPLDIIHDIEEGISGANKGSQEYFVIPDRREAIEFAIKYAEKGDIVIIAGKGHEDYQIIGNNRIHFDDREIAREILRCLP